MEFVGFSNEVLKSYGLIGFLMFVFFSGGSWFVWKITSHFIEQIRLFNVSIADRDAKIVSLSEKFAATINDVLDTLNREREVHTHFLESFQRLHEENRSDHQEILQSIKFFHLKIKG